MSLVVETLAVILVGGFPVWCFVGVWATDRIRYRHEHPEARALRTLAEQDRWSA